jgi:HAD superfamily 5'-nucleotidase-like hydrolase
MNKPVTHKSLSTFLRLVSQFEPQTIRFNSRIFVNRNLRLTSICKVGFDMDYTLAVYNQAFEQLAWDLVLETLVRDFAFPSSILRFAYDPSYAIRGLVVDMSRGNIFKADRFRHVGRSFHGTREIDALERKDIYRRDRISLSAEDCYLVDTLFSVPEACMYALYVDMMDSRPGTRTAAEYTAAYRAIRAATDQIHRDGSLKSRVTKALQDYLEVDPNLSDTLSQFLDSGKQLFLLTNSDWSYTNAVMSFLLDGVSPAYPRWTDYFGLVIVGAGKPHFFTAQERIEFQEFPCDSGKARVLSGGCFTVLREMLGGSGGSVLYVGDHIYGDIVSSKKVSTWRSCMIVPEMGPELAALEKVSEDQAKVDLLFRHRQRLGVELNYQQRLLNFLVDLLNDSRQDEWKSAARELRRLGEDNAAKIFGELEETERQMMDTQNRVLAHFNPRWGMLFKEGDEHSVFGAQVEDYACVYTSKVSNFLSYSPHQYFTGARDLLPHEIEL